MTLYPYNYSSSSPPHCSYVHGRQKQSYQPLFWSLFRGPHHFRTGFPPPIFYSSNPTRRPRWLGRWPACILRPILSGELFFPEFPKFRNNWRYQSRYGVVLSLFGIFSRSKNIRFVKFRIFREKIRKIRKTKKNREKDMETMRKELSDKNYQTNFVGSSLTECILVRSFLA